MAVGGGHGLAATLRAVRRYTEQVTALVSVADDGGSSGRLRDLLGIMPPGDLRKCLVALAEPGSPLATAFEYRFAEEELAGHSLGNLVLAGLMDGNDPIDALDEAGRLLGAKGRVLPATAEPVTLKAEAEGGPVAGQVAVMGTGHIRSVSLVPADPSAPAEVAAAL
ncbi:MAG TPA: gluconeogenesis factor YvcK family protein, partial [Acidimicrobiales bacterium]|nr:gluconeogenesis factor YvcK family protein [Acidimicrobiales bacterium]